MMLAFASDNKIELKACYVVIAPYELCSRMIPVNRLYEVEKEAMRARSMEEC
jgi:hypothetical protein